MVLFLRFKQTSLTFDLWFTFTGIDKVNLLSSTRVTIPVLNGFVPGISSRALFNLEKENEVFEKEGLDAYRDYQIVHENDVLSPGSGFALVKNLLNINKLVIKLKKRKPLKDFLKK